MDYEDDNEPKTQSEMFEEEGQDALLGHITGSDEDEEEAYPDPDDGEDEE